MGYEKETDSARLAKAYIRFVTEAAKPSGNIAGNAKLALSGMKNTTQASDSKLYTVQFNPSRLEFSTERGQKRKKKDFQEKEKKASGDIYISEAIPGIRLSVSLILDGSIDGGRDVQQETEGLIAAVKNCAGDVKASFCWERFVFTGAPESISAEYTMFDGTGRPLRSNVDFTINLSDKEKLAEILDADYQKLFR